VAFVCQPDPSGCDPVQQAEATYAALLDALNQQRGTIDHIVGETIFLRDIRRDADAVLAGRALALAQSGQQAAVPRPAVVQQPPATHHGPFELAVHALIPERSSGWRVRDLGVESGCACVDCLRSGARLVDFDGIRWLQTTHIPGSGADPETQATNMFRSANRLLIDSGMNFRNVVRTWIHLRDIDRDYDILNTVRRRFFLTEGIDPRPASTGVGGAVASGTHDISMSLLALAGNAADATIDVVPFSTPLLNEAWSYGADFSRGLCVTDANAVTLHVSGTASLDESGRSVHAGDLARQAERMLDNIETLLAAQQATRADIVSGIAYVRRASDGPSLRSHFERRGFAGFPCAFVEAALCRSELLCETEVVAMLPLNTLRA